MILAYLKKKYAKIMPNNKKNIKNFYYFYLTFSQNCAILTL